MKMSTDNSADSVDIVKMIEMVDIELAVVVAVNSKTLV
jgi:hypothetical protein